ncbi:MAG: hypothetical protein JNK56_08965, partial [Myxococcales bacterium]|nr:hypothetical protein [Myxococcales bacterium]
TGKLGLPTLPPPTLPAPRPSAPTLASAPTQAAESPRLSQRTDPVSIHGLTELMPEAAVVDTNETALADAHAHTTRPEARTELAPARDALPTELAAPRLQTQPAHVHPPATPAPRRRPLILLAFALVPAIAITAVLLNRGTDETPATIAEPPIAPPLAAPPVAAPPATPPEPTPAPTPTPDPLPAQPPAPTEPAPPEKKPPPVAKKPPLSFQARAKQELGSFRARVTREACLVNYPQTKPLALTIKVTAATGAARLVMPASKQGGGLQSCLERALATLKFTKGAPGDFDLALPYSLPP